METDLSGVEDEVFLARIAKKRMSIAARRDEANRVLVLVTERHRAAAEALQQLDHLESLFHAGALSQEQKLRFMDLLSAVLDS